MLIQHRSSTARSGKALKWSPLGVLRSARGWVLCGALSSVLSGASAWAEPKLKLHVPSPDWRDQVIYFALTDRFADGNPRNNDQGAGEFDPSDPSRYSGGDLAGLRRHLDYIQGLGATTLWITPPVANQWLNAQGSYGGYHGYWARHFMRMDPHVGSLHDYRLLSDALHRRGMYLVQDIVVNHVGDYFYYDAQRREGDPAAGWRANQFPLRPATSTPATVREKVSPQATTAATTAASTAVITQAPIQHPFNLNDPRRAKDRAAGVYHWTPDITDYQNRDQELRFQMSGLDDLHTRNPRVREALRRSYAHWIREVGVDGFRVDTAFYVEPEFFEDFIWRPARAGGTPGMAEVARRTGRQDFLLFGEGFGIDAPGQSKQSQRIQDYIQGPAPDQRRLSGMLNFPLYGALGDVLARGAPTAVLGQRLRSQVALHPRLHWMPSFLDNHDVDRFLSSADERALLQGLATLFTLPGIPVVYYGTEQGFRQQRASMFASGWGSGGQDHFNPNHPLAQALRGLAALRQSLVALRRGWPTILAETVDESGALVWRMSHEGQHVLVALNTADEPVTVPTLPTGSTQVVTLQPAWGLEALPRALSSDAQGRVTLALPPRDLRVWHWQDTALQGTARAGQAQTEAPLVLHTGALDAPWVERLDQADPAADDHGPDGRYRYPLDAAYEQYRPADIRRVQVATRDEASGQALRVTLTMAGVSTVWSPRNGFDHVAFTAFVELPPAGQTAGLEPDGNSVDAACPPGGARVMPLQDGELPGDLRWHRRLRAHGWSLALFDCEGASADHEGRPVQRGVKVQADPARHTITFTWSAAALGRRPSLSGARLWVNTWDWDGRYRALEKDPKAYTFGGGRPGQPRVMDSTEILVLP